MKKKTILIVAFILVVVSVGLCFAVKLGEKQNGDEVQTVVMLTEMDDITYVQYKNEDGIVTLTKTGNVWQCEEHVELALVSGYVEAKIAQLGRIEGELVASATKAGCGLEETVYILVVKDAEQEVKLHIGSDNEGNVYAMSEENDEIYEIDPAIMEIISLSVDTYVAPTEGMHSLEQDAVDDTLVEEELGTEEEPIEDEYIEEEPMKDDE